MAKAAARTDWVALQAKLWRCTLFFAGLAALNIIPGIVFYWKYGLASVVFALFACVAIGMHFITLRQIRGPILFIPGFLGSVAGIVTGCIALAQIAGSGLFVLISPLAMLDDSSNADGHVQKKILPLWLLAGIWFVSAVLGAFASWHIFTAAGELPLDGSSPEDASAPG